MDNHHTGRLCAAALLLAACPCLAQDNIAASASTRYESNSNMLALQTGNLLPGIIDAQRNDTSLAGTGALQARYRWGRQQLFASLDGTDFRYNHFTVLNHDEYNFGGGVSWKLTQSLDGVIEASRSRRMVSFTEVNLPLLSLQTERRELARAGIQLRPDWRLEFDAKNRRVTQTLQGLPDLHLAEKIGMATLLFGGRGGMTAGLSASYADGDFAGSNGSATGNPTYRQTSGELVLNYKSSRTAITGHGGYTRRASTIAQDNIEGVTGELSIVQHLSGKTTVDMLFSRTVSSYITGAGSELDNVAGMNVHWQTTKKVGVVLGYTLTYRELPKQGNAPIGSDRIDRLHLASLAIDWLPLRWLTIKPYANVQNRSSNYIGGNFDATTYGVYVTARWEDAAFR